MKYSFLLFSVWCLVACSDPKGPLPGNGQQNDTAENKPALPAYNNRLVFNNQPGFIGVFKVPEMLSLSLLDSSAMQDVAFKVAKNYGILESEMKAVGAEMEGSPGQITYNNDPKNFKFECFLLIRELPAKQPKQCKIVFLEASDMLVYNFYGAYQDLYTAYDKVRETLKAQQLSQSGPAREFYVTDPSREKDPKNWLTRIMVPVTAVKKAPL